MIQGQEHMALQQEPGPSSSPTTMSVRSNKPKRPPPITPRRFNRFFDARPSRESHSSSGSARILHDLTANSVNRIAGDVSSGLTVSFDDLPGLRSNKRKRSKDAIIFADSKPARNEKLGQSAQPVPASPLKSSPLRSSPLLSSPCRRNSPRGRRTLVFPLYLEAIQRAPTVLRTTPEFCAMTADFCTTPADTHRLVPPALPFCVASCNTNTLVAIGDEDGGVRVIESSKDGRPAFDIPYISFKPHSNAILHLSFSSTDGHLATASGDQTAAITDMPTQKTIHNLNTHTSSLRQVVFQPGDDNVVATCSRDGTVILWDLRSPKHANKIQSIVGGHACDNAQSRNSTTSTKVMTPSITSLQFLSASRSHLFLTSSDVSAQIRLWDIRGRYSYRQRTPTPISTTRIPPAHMKQRQYGISSLALGTDNSRLYAVCKDNTVYVYSTNHVILGQAPEFNSTTPHHWAQRGNDSLGPLYGLRHPQFRTATFYIRAAIRKASTQHAEILSVGSSEACPVLFPTDERSLRRTATPKKRDCIPIYDSGTPLVRGHTREVTSLAWTSDGELVTVGDDYTARCWRENASAARDLRVGGEGEGRRWKSGWADVGVEWDEDDG